MLQYPDSSDVAYGREFWVLSGAHGEIFTSADRQEWTWRYSGTRFPLYRVAGGQKRVIVRAGGNQFAARSDDGKVWVPIAAPPFPDRVRIRTFENTFFAPARSGRIFASVDGEHWLQHSTGAGGTLYDIAFGKGMLIAVGEDAAAVASTNGVNWVQAPEVSRAALFSVKFGNNMFVAVGEQGSILHSNTGEMWSVAVSGQTSETVKDLAFGQGVWVAVGSTAVSATADTGILLRSTNALTWQKALVEVPLNGIAISQDRMVAVSEKGRILIATDGTVWRSSQIDLTASLRGIAFGNERFVAVGDVETGQPLRRKTIVLISTNGIEWQLFDRGETAHTPRINFVNREFYLSSNNRLFSSIDGTDWQLRSTSFSGAITAASGLFLGVSGSNVFSAPDGNAWVQTYTTARDLHSIAYGLGTFVVVGSRGTILQLSAPMRALIGFDSIGKAEKGVIWNASTPPKWPITVYVSDDLNTWRVLLRYTNAPSEIVLQETNTLNISRFYRLSSP